jgi:hypothetical protein
MAWLAISAELAVTLPIGITRNAPVNPCTDRNARAGLLAAARTPPALDPKYCTVA